MTDAELLVLGQTASDIATETATGGNTAARVGTLLGKIVEAIQDNKLNPEAIATAKQEAIAAATLEAARDAAAKVAEETTRTNEAIEAERVRAVKAEQDNANAIAVLGTFTELPEYLYLITDNNGEILFGIKADGSVDIPKGIPRDVSRIFNEFLTALSKKVDKEDGKSLIYEEVAESVGYEDSDDYIEATLDAESKVVSYRKRDGTLHEKKIDCGVLRIEDIFCSQTALERLAHDLHSDVFDRSKDKFVHIPIPTVAAKVNFVTEDGIIPMTKTDDIQAFLEFSDNAGNYFKKPIIWNAQGSSSMSYDKKNFGFDLDDGSMLKFGEWVAQDSFHLKAYYIDSTRCKCMVGYQLTEQVYRTRCVGRQRPWDYLTTEGVTDLDSTGKLGSDFGTGALAHPDGFPIIVTVNGEFYGIYSWQLKKHRDNYMCEKKNAKHIILDGKLSNTTLWTNNGSGSIDWEEFEIRNPKGLVDANGRDYDGDAPKEISDTHPLSAEVKSYIERFSMAIYEIEQAEGAEAKRSKFEEFFLKDFIIDYCLIGQFFYHFDGFSKNWIWITHDGQHWTPTIYDLDSILGQYWKGNFVIPDSMTKDLLSVKWIPSNYVGTLYAEELRERYAELRDTGIFTTENVTELFEKWIRRIGTDTYEKEFEKWSETPSYRASHLDAHWKFINVDSSLTAYEAGRQYAAGDKVYYEGLSFECLDACQGQAPLTALYKLYPQGGGYHESLERIALWMEKRLEWLDEKYDYIGGQDGSII